MDTFLKVNSVDLRVRVEGDGPWLVLVHGVGRSLESWDGVVGALAGRYRTVRYDLRGHGESAKPDGPYRLHDFVEDLYALLKVLGIDSCHLAGFSLGGLISQGFALRYPEVLDRLILLATVAGRNQEEKERVLERLKTVEKGSPDAHFSNSVSRWFTEEFLRNHPDIVAEQAAVSERNDPVAYAAAYRVLATSDLGNEIHRITTPTLIATGEHDIGSNTRMAKYMHEHISNSELYIFPGLKHSILVEAPAEVARLIDRFLTSESCSIND